MVTLACELELAIFTTLSSDMVAFILLAVTIINIVAVLQLILLALIVVL